MVSEGELEWLQFNEANDYLIDEYNHANKGKKLPKIGFIEKYPLRG